MLEQLKKEVYEANMMLVKYNLITFTWGNVSGIDREKGLVVIKPSGVEYDDLTPDMLPVIDLEGNVIRLYLTSIIFASYTSFLSCSSIFSLLIN